MDSATGIKSPRLLAHLPYLELPRQESPHRGPSNDFAAGYSLGLIGGVRSWVHYSHIWSLKLLIPSQMTRRRKSPTGSQTGSPESDGDSSDSKNANEEKSPSRGRHTDRDLKMVEAN